MKLTLAELAFVRAQGLHVTEKCNGCEKLLNQSLRYTITGSPQVYCSAVCRDLAFFRDRREVRKHSSPGKCVYCGGKLEGKRRGALYCDDKCKKREERRKELPSAPQVRLSRTTVEQNQQVADAKIAG